MYWSVPFDLDKRALGSKLVSACNCKRPKWEGWFFVFHPKKRTPDKNRASFYCLQASNSAFAKKKIIYPVRRSARLRMMKFQIFGIQKMFVNVRMCFDMITTVQWWEVNYLLKKQEGFDLQEVKGERLKIAYADCYSAFEKGELARAKRLSRSIDGAISALQSRLKEVNPT